MIVPVAGIGSLRIDVEEETPEADEPKAPARTRRDNALLVGVLVALFGTCILLWIGRSIYRIYADRPMDGSTRYYLPGLRIDLPSWHLDDEQPQTLGVPGALNLKDDSGRGSLHLRFIPGRDGYEPDLLDSFLRIGYEVSETWLARPANQTVTLWYTTARDRDPEVIATFVCRKPYMRFFFRLSSSEGKVALISLAKAILSSAQCHAGTLQNAELLRVPILPQGVHCRWTMDTWGDLYGKCDGEGVVILERGWPGRLSLEQEVGIVVTGLSHQLKPSPDAELVRTKLENAPPRQRTVHRISGTRANGSPRRVLWTIFHCEDVDQTFLATYAGPQNEDDEPNVELLTGLHCPSRRSALDVLTRSAFPTEADHPMANPF